MVPKGFNWAASGCLRAHSRCRIARRSAPLARYWLRSASTAVAARSVSPRTVLASEKAMMDRAAESQRTARSAPPRRDGGLVIDIHHVRRTAGADGRRNGEWPQVGGIV